MSRSSLGDWMELKFGLELAGNGDQKLIAVGRLFFFDQDDGWR